jgi:hypothetical protein
MFLLWLVWTYLSRLSVLKQSNVREVTDVSCSAIFNRDNFGLPFVTIEADSYISSPVSYKLVFVWHPLRVIYITEDTGMWLYRLCGWLVVAILLEVVSLKEKCIISIYQLSIIYNLRYNINLPPWIHWLSLNHYRRQRGTHILIFPYLNIVDDISGKW